MKKLLILILVIVIIALGVGMYFLFSRTSPPAAGNTSPSGGGSLPTPAANSATVPVGASGSNLPDYVGSASEVYGSLPTGTTLQIGTSQGTVTVINFYNQNPPVVEGGTIVIKQTANYDITYNPANSEFWLAVTETPFAVGQAAAEQDFLTTLGVSKTDACKLDVTSGVIYSPGNSLDGESFPLSFCTSGGAFENK